MGGIYRVQMAVVKITFKVKLLPRGLIIYECVDVDVIPVSVVLTFRSRLPFDEITAMVFVFNGGSKLVFIQIP